MRFSGKIRYWSFWSPRIGCCNWPAGAWPELTGEVRRRSGLRYKRKAKLRACSYWRGQSRKCTTGFTTACLALDNISDYTEYRIGLKMAVCVRKIVSRCERRARAAAQTWPSEGGMSRRGWWY